MSVAIAGLWELGHNVPLQEAHLWEMVVRDFEVDKWHMHPVTGIVNRDLTVEWENVGRMLEAMRRHYQLVFVTEHAGVGELRDFKHPADACYVFGRCNWSPFVSFMQPELDLAVRVATRANDGLLWPHQCATVVLWHRGQQWP